jgi:hypothetical protein
MPDNIVYKVRAKITKKDCLNNIIDVIEWGYPSLAEGMLVNAGKDFLIKALRGDSVTPFNNSNAYLGVGDSSTAASVAQTDLQAGVNKLRKSMDAGYPKIYGEGGGPSNPGEILFFSTFTAVEANFAWNEFGLFNASSGGTMFDRFTQSLGTKPSNQVWEFQLTLNFS